MVDNALIVTVDHDVGSLVVNNRVLGQISNDELNTHVYTKCFCKT